MEITFNITLNQAILYAVYWTISWICAIWFAIECNRPYTNYNKLSLFVLATTGAMGLIIYGMFIMPILKKFCYKWMYKERSK